MRLAKICSSIAATTALALAPGLAGAAEGSQQPARVPAGIASATMPPAPVSYVEGTDPAAPLFDPTRIISIDLTAPQGSIDALWADPKGEYQLATMTVTTPDATYGPWDVGLRLKGGWGSFRYLNSKSAFKIKVNDVTRSLRLLGLKKLTLNNMVQDPSMMHEALGYRLFRAMGIAAPRVGYAKVTLNGQIYGIYANIETPDNVMLPRWYESTQHLYEGAYRMDVTPGNEGSFEVDEGDETDRADLAALIDAANSPENVWWSRMRAVADMAQFTRMWAIEAYIGHWDGYSRTIKNNYYLHSDDSGKFTMMPWGIDQTFADRLGWTNTWDAALMFTRCMSTPQCFRLYNAALVQTAAKAAELDLHRMSEDIEAVLVAEALAHPDGDPRREYDGLGMDDERSRTREFLTVRPADLQAHTAPLLPAAPTVELRSIARVPTIAWRGTARWGLPSTGSQVQVARRGESLATAPIQRVTGGRLALDSRVPVRVRVRVLNDLGASAWSPVITYAPKPPRVR